jgi:hypothetical protein
MLKFVAPPGCSRASLESAMKIFASGIVLSLLMVAAVPATGFAQDANLTEAEAKMFAATAGYERFMGRWSRLLAPAYIAFAGVKDGDRVLDVGTGPDRSLQQLKRACPRARSSASIPRKDSSPTRRGTPSPSACTLKSVTPRH